MLKKIFYWLGSAILVSVFIVFTGCGGDESGLESTEEVIAVELTAHDSGDSSSDPTFTIDVKRGSCGTPDAAPPDLLVPEDPVVPENPEEASAEIEEVTAEPYYDTLGKATFYYTFYCPTCPPGADETYIIDNYTVEYVPVASPKGGGGHFYPPELVSLGNRSIVTQMVLSKDFTTAERSFILIPVNTKNEFQEKSIRNDTPRDGAFYDIIVHFHGRNRAGGSFTTTSMLQVIFGDYYNCDE
ncbi:MAG: hypothetical protein U9Q05_11120 [Thermodesulfobacteriota bacterium]|nr:hypothetical protein [Thermodesulfobacteriota bacterium]